MRALSLHHLTMLGAHPLELVDAAAAGGFSHCGIRLVPPTAADSVFEVVGQPETVRAIGQRLRDRQVQLLDIEAVWLQPSTAIALLLPALEAGRTLGARHVLAVGHDPQPQRLFDHFCQLCEAAAGLDLGVGLEFISYCSVGTLDQALALVRESRQPNARVLVDALQFFRSGAQPADLASAAPLLAPYAQICDGVREAPPTLEARRNEARTDRRLPGEGELPIAALLAALPGGITLSLEAPTRKLAGLPFDEQGCIVGAALRRFLHPHDTG
jgi:sugar phosphate isomerase/epimerase